MKNLLKSIISIFVASSLALGFAGCSSNANTESVLSKVTKSTIKVAVNEAGEKLKTFQSVLDKLNAKSNYYKLVIQDIPINSYFDEIKNLIDSNKAPDLMFLDSNSKDLNTFIKQGAFLDITKQAKDDKIFKLNNYFKSVIDLVTYNGKLYGIPYSCSPTILYYNKDLFDKAGVSYPNNNWKWEDFKDAAKKLAKDTDGDGKTDQWGVDFNVFQFSALFQSYGADLNNIKSNEFVNALDMYFNIINNDKSSVPSKEVVNSNFLNEKIAMQFDTISPYTSFSFNFGIAELPYEKNRCTDTKVSAVMINAKTHYKDVSYKALVDLTKVLSSDKAYVVLPPTKDGFDSIIMNRFNKNIDMNIIKNTLDYNNCNTLYNDLYLNIYNQVMWPIIIGTKTVEQAVKDAATALAGSK